MRKIVTKQQDLNLNDYDISLLTSDSLILDIETTGLSPLNAFIYLIGFTYLDEEHVTSVQLFAESAEDEILILYSFLEYLTEETVLVSFNGNRFDIPFLQKRMDFYSISYTLYSHDTFDLYKVASSIAPLLHLQNKKQKTLELFLGIGREDLYHGRELIQVYFDFLEHKNEMLASLLLLHNFEDITGLLQLLPLLRFRSLFYTDPVQITCHKRSYKKWNDDEYSEELLIHAEYPYDFPRPVMYRNQHFYIKAENHSVNIMVYLIKDTLYHFYPDYKNYEFLIQEGYAIHKSISQFLSKDVKQKASAENCYTKKTGVFLPCFSKSELPIFHKAYKDKVTYIEFDDSMILDAEFITTLFLDLRNQVKKSLKI
ncbi:MAG: ribonuclease H-like domain-containing protein [Lachnospiraceae bacterium]